MSADLVIFLAAPGSGGVDRMLVNIATGIAARGHEVELVTGPGRGAYESGVGERVERIALPGRNDAELATALLGHLQRVRPTAVLTAKGRDDRIALKARDRLADPAVRFFLRVGTAVGGRVASRGLPWLGRWRQRRRLRAMYARCDGVLANAEAVAGELAAAADVQRTRIQVVPNPTVTAQLHEQAAEPVGHPWLTDAAAPVILGIGGLRRTKDFATLVRALAVLRRSVPARLIILGEGRQRRALERLAAELGVAEHVDLPGFASNPYAYLARADALALSSRYEGLPNVVIESLAVGTPVVATDCPGGIREILADGAHGRLVPVADPEALAGALARTLRNPPAPQALREAAQRYSLDTAAAAYARALGLEVA